MAIFPEGDIYMCQCMEQNQVRMGNILFDEPQKILQELENLLEKMKLRNCSVLNIKKYVKNVTTDIYAVDVVWHRKNRMITGVFS